MAAPNSSPPRIDTQSPITPSNEWADMTTSALGTKNVLHSADSTNAWAGSSAASTPGPDFPGSYPRNEYPTSTAPENGSLLDSARQYLPAQEDVQHAITSAGQTAKYYLPTGVANYMSGTTEKQPAVSLPSTEVGGAKPFEATGGVGALPGRISEAGVATLPAERVVDEKAAQAASSKPNPEQDASAAKANPEQQPLPPQRLTPRLGLALAREKGLNKSVDEDEEELPTKVVPAEPVRAPFRAPF
ncbi:hypothetical protein PLICRDRAFT_119023 [Plicaturopsis crispa FD-325 SS-3]|uniref:Uncharacterized protein n=1 Tax=Plicaturopsis crispa FD-325 SS-3 TaxID=944288 RepID=A0A0C9SWK7_PLICR|nr:hypothetical protein PLICRDRAFT_119023 [Plicaturopsis crispa FD-325 SS-3]